MPSEAISTITVGSTSYGASGTYTRGSRNLILNALALNFDGTAGSLAFSEMGPGLAAGGLFKVGQRCTLAMAGSGYAGGAIFGGEIVDKGTEDVAGVGLSYRYTARSFEYAAGLVPVTNPVDLTGLVRYNLRRTDDGYDDTLARLTVAQIMQRMLDGHATALAAAGVTGYVAGDLTPLSIVPPTPVIFRGANVWVRLVDFLRDWHGKYLMFVDPTGTIRIVDSLTTPQVTLQIGVDRVAPPSLRRSSEGCASRVVTRGQDIREIAYLALSDGTLAANYTTAGYKYTDFSQPAGAFDKGSIGSVTPTSCVYTSDSPTASWVANFLQANGANAFLVDPVATGIQGFERRAVLSNTALAAGGSCTINFDYPISNLGYTRAALTMIPRNESKVYREFAPANAYVAAHMEQYSHFPFQWVGKNQVIQTSQATAVSVWNGAVWPAPIEVDAHAGVIRTYEPIVKPWNTMADLNAGTITNVPQDVQAAVPYTVGVLTAAYPPDTVSGGVTTPHYGGTLFSEDGVSRTYTVEVPSWIWRGDQANMAALAQSIWETISNTRIEGTVVVRALDARFLSGPVRLNIASTVGTTNMESMAIQVKSVTVTWISVPGGAVNFTTGLYVSNVRRRNHGDAYYIHPGTSMVPFGGFGSVAGSIEGSRAEGHAADPNVGGGFNQ